MIKQFLSNWKWFLICVSVHVYAQKGKHYDTTFVKTDYHKLLICPGASIPLYAISINERSTLLNYKTASLFTTSPLLIGGHVAYRNLSFQLFVSAISQLQDEQNYGRSKIFGLYTRMGLGKLAIEAQIRSLRNLYDLSQPLTPDQQSFQNYPNAGLTYVKVKGMYIFSKKLSYSASFTGNEIQKRSAFSFLMEGSLHRTVLQSDSNFVPFYNPKFTNDVTKDFSRNSVNAFGLAPGVMGTLVYKNYFASLFMVFGCELQHHSFYNAINTSYLEKWYLSPFYDLRSSVGFNNGRVFTSLNFKLDYISMNINDYNIGYSYLLLSVSMGYKFNSPKFLNTAHKFIFKKYE